jgi:hypothetical protein
MIEPKELRVGIPLIIFDPVSKSISVMEFDINLAMAKTEAEKEELLQFNKIHNTDITIDNLRFGDVGYDLLIGKDLKDFPVLLSRYRSWCGLPTCK